jgi:exosortase A-associated hydrolase 1
LGILHYGAPGADKAVLLVVGGPQYRVGSHRQFVLLARHIAAAGIPVLRFDYRGMGDSDGGLRSFEDAGEDIRAAVDTLAQALPRVERVVIWGLCDAASAACLYAPDDPRIAGLVLLNPWVRTQAGEAKAYLRHYYLARLRSPEFWSKLFSGGLKIRRSVASLLAFLMATRIGGSIGPNPAAITDGTLATPARAVPTLPDRMLRALERFRGRVLLILSGNDLTAKEFKDLADASADWRNWARRAALDRWEIPDADHTFSSEPWQTQVAVWSTDWLRSW